MRVSVDFEDGQLALDVPGEALVGSWSGPRGLTAAAAVEAARQALEHPVDFPPVRQLVVPGDRVAIALDYSFTGVDAIIQLLDDQLRQSGVQTSDITVVSTAAIGPDDSLALPRGTTLEAHDPSERPRLAYLSATKEGRRVYLNRHLTDADVVIPVGRLGYDPVLGYRGPWSVIFPGLSDGSAAASYRGMLAEDSPGRRLPRRQLDEPFEVSWLLGAQFHLGLVPGASGLVEVVAGLAEPARDRAIEAINRHWSYQPPARAECVVAGIGESGTTTGIEALVDGLVTASRLVNHGGRIVALSRARGAIGPSLQRLCDAGDARNAAVVLRGHDADADSVSGRRLAQVLAWADVYLLSALDRQVVEDIGMIPVDQHDDVRRLVSRSNSALVVNRAELTRATVKVGEQQ